MQTPVRAGFDVTLADGTPVWVRPVVPSDQDGIRRGYREMSRTSRYMRFFGAGSEMSERAARYFTHVDQRDHIAWCGVEPASNRRGYGIARFVRDRDRPAQADFAVAVIDEMQRKGLGTILLAVLYLLAQARGINELRGEMLPENPVMPLWMPRLGASIEASGDPAYRIIRWPIGRGDEPPAETDDGRRFAQTIARLRPLFMRSIP